jgi:hypothetical protein
MIVEWKCPSCGTVDGSEGMSPWCYGSTHRFRREVRYVETVEETTDQQAERFEAIRDAEMEVQGAKAQLVCEMPSTPLYIKNAHLKAWRRAKANLSALVDALSPEDGKAYGEWRRGVLSDANESV